MKAHGNFSSASVTIEDGFGFEAVVPVKSPIKSSRWDAVMAPSGFFAFGVLSAITLVGYREVSGRLPRVSVTGNRAAAGTT